MGGSKGVWSHLSIHVSHVCVVKSSFKEEAEGHSTAHVTRQSRLTRSSSPGGAGSSQPVLRGEDGGSLEGSGSGGAPGSWERTGRRGLCVGLPAPATSHRHSLPSWPFRACEWVYVTGQEPGASQLLWLLSALSLKFPQEKELQIH